jgi:hypothetical protein
MENIQNTQTEPSINKDLALVKEQISYHEAQAEYHAHANNPYRQKRHAQTAARFRALYTWAESLIAENESLRARASPLGYGPQALARPKQLSLSLTPEDIAGLPDEVIQALGLNTGDRTDLAIVTLIENAGGILSLDKILIGLYRRTREIHKRQQLVQRLYRLSQKGQVFPVPGKKGVYSLHKMTEAEVEKIFNPQDLGT